MGHDAAEQFSFHWWDHVFNEAAANIAVRDGQVRGGGGELLGGGIIAALLSGAGPPQNLSAAWSPPSPPPTAIHCYPHSAICSPSLTAQCHLQPLPVPPVLPADPDVLPVPPKTPHSPLLPSAAPQYPCCCPLPPVLP